MLRTFLAEKVPLAFGRLQRHGFLPNPWTSAQHVRLGGRASGYSERVVGEYAAARPLASFGLTAGDVVSERYRARFADVDRASEQPRAYGVLTASNVKLWPRFGVHAASGASFIDVYCSDAALANPKYEVPRLLLPYTPTRRRIDEGVLLNIAWSHNHYHWLIDIVPRLALVRDELAAGTPLIVPPDLRPVQRDALIQVLKASGFASARVIEPEAGPSLVNRLVMPTRLAHPLDVSPLQIDVLRTAFCRASGEPRASRRIYISRNDAAIRRIANEAELWPMLERRGFERVLLAKLSLAEQVELFQDADWIVGHHGAGFTNIAFASQGTRFLEIFQAGHFAPSFARMAQLNGLRYGFAVGEADGVDTIVDPATIAKLIDILDDA